MPINDDYVHPDDNINLRWNSTLAEEVRFPNGTTEYAARHPNGGGWVSISSFVSHSVFVDVFGCVYGGSNVTGNVHVNPFGQIYNNATVSGDVNVGVDSDGSSSTRGTAQIRGTGKVLGNVLVSANSSIELSNNIVMGNIVVSENTAIIGTNDVFGNYFTIDAGPSDVSYPNGPQAHSDYNPITRELSIGLSAGTFALVDNNFAHIEELNIRDKLISTKWDIPEDEEPPDPYEPQAEIVDRPTPVPPPVTVPMQGKKKPVKKTETSKPKPTSKPSPSYGSCPSVVMERLKRTSRNGGEPPAGVLYNLQKLCQHVVQPILKVYPNIIITSGWRVESSTHHGKGMAFDFQVPGKTQIEVGRWIANNLEFSQLILEYQVGASPNSGQGKWVHVSYIDPNTPLGYNGNFGSNVGDIRVADNGGPNRFRTKHHSLVATNITSSRM